MSSGSAASRRSWSSEAEEGGTPRAARARRRVGVGSSLEVVAKREKASLISDSVAADMLFSFAMADWRGAFSLGGGAGAGARRLGGCWGVCQYRQYQKLVRKSHHYSTWLLDAVHSTYDVKGLLRDCLCLWYCSLRRNICGLTKPLVTRVIDGARTRVVIYCKHHNATFHQLSSKAKDLPTLSFIFHIGEALHKNGIPFFRPPSPQTPTH